MKIKVDKLTAKEFSEYADSTFAKLVKMTLGIFLGVVMLVIVLLIGFNKGAELLKNLWICAGILAFLLILGNSSIGILFKKSGLSDAKCSYVFNESGMDISVGDLSGDLEWKYVKYLKETEHLFILRVPKSQFIIPKRCLKNEEEFCSLMENVLPAERIKKLKYKKKDRGTKKDGDSKD